MKGRAAFALVCCLVAGVALAQTAKPKPEHKPEAKTQSKAEPQGPPQPLNSGAPPYETPLLRLSELLGTLSYLRDLCGFADGAEFRARMATLLNSEAASGPRRDRIAGYFNRGFREYELLHRTCTPVSREVVRRAMAEAGTLARDIASRYGGT